MTCDKNAPKGAEKYSPSKETYFMNRVDYGWFIHTPIGWLSAEGVPEDIVDVTPCTNCSSCQEDGWIKWEEGMDIPTGLVEVEYPAGSNTTTLDAANFNWMVSESRWSITRYRPVEPQEEKPIDLTDCMDLDTLGARLRSMRKSKGMSLDVVAEKLDMGKGNISDIENGNIKNPGIITIGRIVNLLGRD
ncbi:MAG: helix-turn-helix transcriptional regulator [Syntrophobacteria bacterium]